MHLFSIILDTEGGYSQRKRHSKGALHLQDYTNFPYTEFSLGSEGTVKLYLCDLFILLLQSDIDAFIYVTASWIVS